MMLGYIGLGKMGKNMVLRLNEQGIQIIAWNRSPEPRKEVAAAGVKTVETIDELISELRLHPRGVSTNSPIIIWVMLTAGQVTNSMIADLAEKLSPGDLVIDGGNSFYKDTLDNAALLKEKDIHFMDIGTSGGPGGARSGACLMIGGERGDFERIEELCIAAAAPNAYGLFGPVGSGHFVKMIHNGIEYGMMEAIAEGAAILKYSDFNLDLPEIFRVYNNRSVIESRLVGWTLDALKEDVDLKDTSSVVKSTGEGEWTIKTAKEMGIDVPVIEKTFEVRQKSPEDEEDSPAGYRNKVVSAQRGKFGQHAVKKD